MSTEDTHGHADNTRGCRRSRPSKPRATDDEVPARQDRVFDMAEVARKRGVMIDMLHMCGVVLRGMRETGIAIEKELRTIGTRAVFWLAQDASQWPSRPWQRSGERRPVRRQLSMVWTELQANSQLEMSWKSDRGDKGGIGDAGPRLAVTDLNLRGDIDAPRATMG
ncbi:hypothetical protein B0H13DRAFT_1987860 [Mycena leptocephala]|nr:hypothetical protein B0H13DRAFT_1987860 [Mycena leptocephala]